MACVTVEDYIRPYVKWKETTLAKVSKSLFNIIMLNYLKLKNVP